MDDAERIPIDLGYDVAAFAEPASEPRMTVREDGTILIDILAPQSCASDPATDEEIVVCGSAPAADEIAAPPLSESPVDRISNALSFKIGSIELGLIKTADGTRALGVRTEF
jgi:hypothetical protein